MLLTDKQKKFLRGLAHDLKPVIQVGNAGLSPGLLAELNLALEHHELLKTKLRVGDREARDEVIEEMLKKTEASLVARIGNTAVLYRERKEKPSITLP